MKGNVQQIGDGRRPSHREKEALDAFYEAVCLIVNRGKGPEDGIRIAEKEILKEKVIAL